MTFGYIKPLLRYPVQFAYHFWDVLKQALDIDASHLELSKSFVYLGEISAVDENSYRSVFHMLIILLLHILSPAHIHYS